MGKYYYLVSGLPDISLDDGKLAYTVADFRAEMEATLSAKDQKLIDLFFLKYDNANLLAYLKDPDASLDPRGRIAREQFEAVYKALKEEEKLPKDEAIPAYHVTFIQRYLAEEQSEQKGEKAQVSWEDQLAALYYEAAMKAPNPFVAGWFELNLNINNVLTAITCRKYGFDKSLYIVGHNEIAEQIRTSNARDFGLSDAVEYLPELQRIAEETDLYARERKIDLLKWKWLEDQTFFKTFDMERVFAYLLQLEMIERWVNLDKVRGEQTFRELVGAMKKGSDHALEEFKRNNIK
ncbi:DUF2764 domain-containing protein [Parabacteroides distasonis]|nr:DUF2764 domain-containing protein [Parabacteroides distasonis]